MCACMCVCMLIDPTKPSFQMRGHLHEIFWLRLASWLQGGLCPGSLLRDFLWACRQQEADDTEHVETFA